MPLAVGKNMLFHFRINQKHVAGKVYKYFSGIGRLKPVVNPRKKPGTKHIPVSYTHLDVYKRQRMGREQIALAAWKLTFTHPETGKTMTFSHLPENAVFSCFPEFLKMKEETLEKKKGKTE